MNITQPQNNSEKISVLRYALIKTYMSKLVSTTRFWNNLHHVRSKTFIMYVQ